MRVAIFSHSLKKKFISTFYINRFLWAYAHNGRDTIIAIAIETSYLKTAIRLMIQ
jgi:hypothetical protein